MRDSVTLDTKNKYEISQRRNPERPGLVVVTVRLDRHARGRLAQLAELLGGRRAAVSRALRLLHRELVPLEQEPGGEN